MFAKSKSRQLFRILDNVVFAGILTFLLLLPFHLVIKRLVPGPLGTYWKEILLAVLVALWGLRRLVARSDEDLRPSLRADHTALDWAVIVYLGLLFLRFVLDRNWEVGAWGLYVSVLYLPLFWLVADTLACRPNRLIPLLASLVSVGAVVALGGLAEFVWNVPLWPSDEMVQRQGFPGVFIYNTNIRRVYFTFDSPTTLANTLAMLLPLAVALFLFTRRLWLRLLAAVAGGLIAACIVATFSRGIWVAMVLSLAIMGIWLVRRQADRPASPRLGDAPASPPAAGRAEKRPRSAWKPLLVIGAVLLFIVLAWAAVWLAWRPWESTTFKGVVELSPEEYRAVPMTGSIQSLMALAPGYGEAVTQTWTLPDPLTALPDTRRVLYLHPPEAGKAELIYQIRVPESGALRFSIALSPDVWTPEKGDGADFQVYVVEPGQPGQGRFLFARYVNPKQNPTDRRWRNYALDLSPWAGRTVNLSLITDSGKSHDWSFDWAGWADLQVGSVESGYFEAAAAASPILRHTGSILDWARDETNRDRLAAWGQGFSAWRSAPLWGIGLGSTGVAALRTRPEQALVTESQMLKALVELGPLGLLLLAWLWFQIGRVGYRAYRTTADRGRRLLIIGILTSLVAVFIEGWVYQNLEVKQVNAYFWTLIGMVAFLASRQKGPEGDRSEDGAGILLSADTGSLGEGTTGDAMPAEAAVPGPQDSVPGG